MKTLPSPETSNAYFGSILFRRFLFFTAAVLLTLVCTSAPAQQTDEPQPLQQVSVPPAFGTFYLIQNKNSPPYPFDPFFGQLAIYEWKPGVYLVDDSQVDYAALAEQKASKDGGMSMMSGPAPCEQCPTNGDGGGVSYSGPPAYSYTSNDLWLEITSITNSQAFFVVHTPDTFESYDLFSTTNLALTTNVGGLNRTNWIWLMRTATSQTNLVLTNLWPSEGWFQLGTMLDSDGDLLPDAFEINVSMTNPQLRDSDHDGIEDGDEMGPNGLPWRLEQARRSSAVMYASAPAATEGGACGQFTVYLPAPAPSGGATVKYRFGGTATLGLDFSTTPTGNALTIAAGNSSGSISICAVNDPQFSDLDRYVEVTLTNVSFCPVDSQVARVTLVDNDLPEVRVFAMPQWVRKPSPTFGTNTAGFFFVRDGDNLNAVNLNFSLSGSAVSGTDYNALSSPINFPAGVRTNYLPVTLKPTTNTADKTLTLNISSASGYQLDPAASSATMTIASSTLTPLPVVQVTATDDDAREPSNPGTFTFTRAGPTTAPLRVFYRVTGTASAAGVSNNVSDYLELPGVVDFGVGQSSVPVTVSPFDNDLEDEIMETVSVVLSAGDYRVGTANSATVFIDDNASPSYVAEVVRPGVHGFNAPRPLYGRVTRYGTAVSPGSAGWTFTYTSSPNILSSVTPGGNVSGNNVVWAARQSVANITFETTWSQQNDTVYNVNLNLNGSPFGGYRMYLPQSQLVRVTSTGSPATVITEGQNINTLTFTRPHPSSASLNVGYTVLGSAVSGTDFTGLSGAVNFPANGGGPITVAVQALSNPQTNGWKTAVITLNANNISVGDVALGTERAFFRIQDAQVSNPVFDTDIDNDGLSDGWELANLSDGFDPTQPNNAYADTDRDGLQLFEEIQLGTNPNVADAQPTYPSEDPDDYVTLKLALGAKGKLPDLAPASCATCHSAGMTVGMHTRSTPRTSRDFQNNLQEHLIRFLRGSSYPARVTDNPLAKVLPSSQTNSTPHLYTAAYTAQFLTASNAAYTLVTDTNQLFGTNRPMVLETLGRQATLFVPDLLIATDVDRDGIVNTSNRVDRTSANAPMVFWINNNVDFVSDNEAEDRDPSTNAVNSANTIIDNLRDLEDFVRLHFRVEGLPGQLLTNAGLQTRIYLTNLVGTPSLRLYRAAETSGGRAFLTNTTTGTTQLGKGAFGVLTNGTALTIAGTEWLAVATNRFLLPTIFEGISTGRCVIVFTIASNTGPDVAFSRPFYLDLRRISDLYEHWTVGDNITSQSDQIPFNAARTSDSAVFGSPQSPQDVDYILFVHGWRMPSWERRAFANTSYKRLWHLGYKGRFGMFSWPTDWCLKSQVIFNPSNFPRSEQRAWYSAIALNGLLNNLNRAQGGHIRMFAHSMGNMPASEALRIHGFRQVFPLVHSYVPTQAATVAHAYDSAVPSDGLLALSAVAPNLYANYVVAGSTNVHFNTISRAVGIDAVTQLPRIINLYNAADPATTTPWRANQLLKPLGEDETLFLSWDYSSKKQWLRYVGMLGFRSSPSQLILDSRGRSGQQYEVFARSAEAYSMSLGSAEQPNGSVIVRGEISRAINLNLPGEGYDDPDNGHSAQFLSTYARRQNYWRQLLQLFELN